MAEAQAALESVAMYFDTLMLLAKVAVACLVADSVMLAVLGMCFCAAHMRRS